MVTEISPDEVREKLADGDVQIVDIRPPERFAEGHIPGAVNLPMSDLPDLVDDVDWGEDVVVACPIGQSSVQAAKLISSYEGVEDDACVCSMAGGYREWDGELETGP